MSIPKYYTPPSRHVFDEVKNAAIKIWKGYDDTYGYASNKIRQVKELQNVGDNFMFMYAMFDWNNQPRLMGMVSEEAQREITERMEP